MTRLRLPLIVFVALSALELVFLTFVDTTTMPLDRSGQPFLIDRIASGTTMTQRFEVGADGVDEIRLDGSITSGPAPSAFQVRVVEVDQSASVKAVVRETTLRIPAEQTECCTIRFDGIPDARWRSFRLDIQVGDLRERRLALWAAPATVNGRLTINGQPKRAFLVFTTGASQGTPFARLRSSGVGKSGALAILALLYNAGVAAIVLLIPSASDPRRA